MSNAICATIFLVIAFVSYTQAKKEKEAGDKNRERIWMFASVLTGAGAVLSILSLLFG